MASSSKNDHPPFGMFILSQDLSSLFSHKSLDSELTHAHKHSGIKDSLLPPQGGQDEIKIFIKSLKRLVESVFKVQKTDGGLSFNSQTNLKYGLDILFLSLQGINIATEADKLLYLMLSDSLKDIWPDCGWFSGLLRNYESSSGASNDSGSRSRADYTMTSSFLTSHSGYLSSQKNDLFSHDNSLGIVIYLSFRIVPICSMLSFRERAYIAISDNPLKYGASGNFQKRIDKNSPMHHLVYGHSFDWYSDKCGFLDISLRVGTINIHFTNVKLPENRIGFLDSNPNSSLFAWQRIREMLEVIHETMIFADPAHPWFIAGNFNMSLDATKLLSHLKGVHQLSFKISDHLIQAPEAFWHSASTGYFLNDNDDFNSLNTYNEHAEIIPHDPKFNPLTSSVSIHHTGIIHEWLLFDEEPACLMDFLAQHTGCEFCELPVRFPPTYPYTITVSGPSTILSERINSANDNDQNLFNDKYPPCAILERESETDSVTYMAFRHDGLPGWSDRIWMNAAALDLMSGWLLLSGESNKSSSMYCYQSDFLAPFSHKSVYLAFR